MSKYHAKVTIEFNVTIPGVADEYRADEVEQEITDVTDVALDTLYGNLHNSARATEATADVELKPFPTPSKRSSKRRR